MSYISQQDLQSAVGLDKLIQLTDEDNTGQVNTDRVQQAIDAGCGLFDAYARTRYTIPVPVTPMVRSLCIDLALFELIKGRATYADEGIYKVRKDAYDAALKTLRSIHSGEAALDVPMLSETESNPGASNPVAAASSVKTPFFTDDKLSSY